VGIFIDIHGHGQTATDIICSEVLAAAKALPG
jgi:hypothetical protein